MNKISPKLRHRARRFAVQAVYQWQLTKTPMSEIELQFLVPTDLPPFDRAYFRKIIHGVLAYEIQLDEFLAPALDRPINELSPVELGILRLGTFELKYCLDVPYRVIINEAVELAKIYGAADSYRYVNGVLDQVATSIRSVERQHHRPSDVVNDTPPLEGNDI